MKSGFIHFRTAYDKFDLILLSIFSFLLLFFCSQLSPLYPINEWDDVNLYFNIGKCVAKGRALYAETFDQKGPVIFFIYTLGYLISHTSFWGVFIIELIVWLALIISIYNSAKLFVKREFAFVLALIFPIFILRYIGYGGSAEEFILAFEAVSLYFFLKYLSQDKPAKHNPCYMLIHGVLCSLVLFTKINLIIFWFFPLAAVFLLILISKEFKNFLINIAAFLAGNLIVAAPIILYLYVNDALYDAYEAYIVFNSKYANIQSFSGVISTLIKRAYDLFRTDITFFFLSFAGVLLFPVLFIRNVISKIALLLCGASVYAFIFMGLTFHYYYPLPFALFCLPGLIVLCRFLERFITIQYTKPLGWLFMIIILLVGIKDKGFYGVGGDILLRRASPDNMAFRFEEIINKEPNPTLLNLGFGYGNSVFTVCDIVPNVKYFITPNVPHDMFPDLRNEQEKYLLNKEVKFVILPNFSVNYEYFKDLPALHDNYELVDTYISSVVIYRTFYTYYLYKRRN